MDFLRRNKIAISVVVIIIIVFIVYGIFFGGGGSDEALVVSDETVAQQDAVGAELLSLLTSLRGLTLDGTIFESNLFQGLTDFGQELLPQPVGRPNPFAPIGG